MTRELMRTKRGPYWMMPFGHEPWGDVFFDRLWPEWQRDRSEEWTPSIDFSEKDGKYFLNAELPGLAKDDITLSVHDGVLTLSGRKESHLEEEGKAFYLKETRQGSFSRSFRLHHEVEEGKIEANFKNGVLTVTLPHKKETAKKKIEIKS